MEFSFLETLISRFDKDSTPLNEHDCRGDLVHGYLQASKKLSQKLETLSREVEERKLNMDSFFQELENPTEQNLSLFPSSGEIAVTVPNSTEINEWVLSYEEETYCNWHSTAPATTFSTRGQIRRGSAHGKGGRLPGSGAQVRRNYCVYARIVIYKRLYSLLTMQQSNCTVNDRVLLVAQKMVHDISSEDSHHFGDVSYHEIGRKFLGVIKECAEAKLPNSIEHLPWAIMGITARFTKSDFVEPIASLRTSRAYNARERHIITTWVDKNGGVRCTCIGSTQYEIFAANEDFGTSCCMHAQAVIDVLKELCRNVFGTSSIPIRILYEGLAVIFPETLNHANRQLPAFRSAHGERTILLIDEDISTRDQLCWIPIRKVQRGGGRPLCAFCDLVNSNHCHHITAYLSEIAESGQVEVDPDSVLRSEQREREHDFDAIDTVYKHINDVEEPSRSANHQPISTLPLSPVNCRWAIQVDQVVCDLLKTNGVFKVNAPMICTHCENPRIENTRETNTSGVIMCSLGACSMEIETYSCSGCARRFSAEGRKEGIFIDSICLAATHKLLRDQLIGFALGNGTLSSRLSQFHSQVASFEDSKLFQTDKKSKSSRKMYDLCVYFVKLMVFKPSVSLFSCETCQVENGTLKKGLESERVLRALCVDGIWAGYQNRTVVPFENVSQPCAGPTSFSRSAKSTFRKPKTTFLRLEKTVTILLSAIKGRSIEATHGSIPAIVAAVRIASETALPAEFYVSSICGTFPTDYRNDIGEGCLKKLKELTTALFHRETVVYRLLEPMQKLFQRQGKRRKTSVPSNAKLTDSQAYNVVTMSISRISQVIQNDEVIAWNKSLLPFVKKADLGRKLLLLYTSTIQGPLTHLIRRDDIPSVALLANACTQYKPEDFMKAMFPKKSSETSEPASERPKGAHILESMRLFAAGLFSAFIVDKETKNGSNQTRLLAAFGGVLVEAVKLVEAFYRFYDTHVSEGGSTAAQYARDWQSRDFKTLRERFKLLSGSEQFQPSWGADYDDPFVTGAYFPSLPQVRPLPFNDKKEKIGDMDSYGFCSKHYLQRNSSFTPGALTFSCSCSHPKVLGFKVLERDEGPRAVLDVLVSRFASLPAFVIYDFACGVYKSAVNALWWVIESSTLVSDPFHANNHSCSPAFVPSAHVNLNMLNTVSHEQRNRPIARIKGSLQQTGQDVYISLLAYQILINNIEAKGRRAEEVQVPVANRSAKDIEWSFFHRLGMTCLCCCYVANDSVKVDETVKQDV